MPKQKLYKCKHCNHETTDRTLKWQHIRTHVTPEKLLACKSCPFVTEYKHHLDYHQRNHSGYKPYKCEQCDYQCVNLSMLKSHSKSHSPLCPYQCGQCKYATKYAHSLKMHLKKYCHQMAPYGNDQNHIINVETMPACCKKENDKNQSNNNNNSQGIICSSSPTSSTITSTSATSPSMTPCSSNGTPISITPTSATSPSIPEPPQHCVLDLRVNSKLQIKTEG